MSFSQSGLDAWTHGPLGGNPLPVNVMMGVVGTLLGAALTLYLAVHTGPGHDGCDEDVERMPLICEEEDEGYGAIKTAAGP